MRSPKPNQEAFTGTALGSGGTRGSFRRRGTRGVLEEGYSGAGGTRGSTRGVLEEGYSRGPTRVQLSPHAPARADESGREQIGMVAARHAGQICVLQPKALACSRTQRLTASRKARVKVDIHIDKVVSLCAYAQMYTCLYPYLCKVTNRRGCTHTWMPIDTYATTSAQDLAASAHLRRTALHARHE